jgi:histidyl-tRNA synthetase
VLDGVMEIIGLGGEAHAAGRLSVLRAIDKLDRLGSDGVKRLLGAGRKDESGDFTKGAELNDRQIEAIFQAFKFRIEFKEIAGGISQESIKGELPKPFFGMSDKGLLEAGRSELVEIAKLVRSAGYSEDRIRIDPSVVRGLEYYTGPVYEVELLLDTKDEKGRPVRFGSVGGGGRYDGLVSRFRGEPVPATGFSIGVSRLMAALTLLGKIDSKPDPGPVLVTVFDRERLADYQQMVKRLRDAGIRAELFLGNPKNFGNQLKYADKRGAPCAVIQGSDEKAKGEVTIKDLILGAELSKLDKGRDEYLQKQAQAQQTVPEAGLVEAVRAVLARHQLDTRQR